MCKTRLAAAGAVLGAAMLCGCGKASPPPPPPQPPQPAKPADLTPQKAAELACRLANQAFAAERFRNPQGERVYVKVQLRPASWQVAEKQRGRWVFRSHPAAGPQAEVSFDPDGNNPVVNVDFTFK